MGSWFSKKTAPSTELQQICTEIHYHKEHIASLDQRRSSLMFGYALFIFILGTIFSAHSWIAYDHPTNLFVIGAATFATIAIIAFGIYVIRSFFRWRSSVATQRLENARTRKEEVLERVRDTMPFREAQTILERYTDETKSIVVAPTPYRDGSMAPPPVLLNRVIHEKPVRLTPGPTRIIQPKPFVPPVTKLETPKPDVSTSKPVAQTQNTPVARPRPVIKPILQQARPVDPSKQVPQGVFDRLIDFFTTDGPENKIALLCQRCGAHNGMIFEGEYKRGQQWMCLYCRAMNRTSSAPSSETSTPKATAASVRRRPDHSKDSSASNKSNGTPEEKNVEKPSVETTSENKLEDEGFEKIDNVEGEKETEEDKDQEKIEND
ncbi:unnamed protein product [Caenorhabditis auriculariae]|uniref:Endoplasmic reticulum junction formation protein lunapark n=1 Tax=Caenorhabditis auriculariae TaxID=2777116 RepID=A0A8S1GQI9_9PELO|nr:unnamed protein product [Caenorhabditis auriculariae]